MVNGYGLAAVITVCVTVLVVVLLWALVRLGQQSTAPSAVAGPGEPGRGELTADEEFAAVLEHNRAGRAALGQQIAEAAARAERERRGEW
ncbi:hypothetical protein [Streptomyces sp. GbtcB6]|uniref:hypothetical protein n=1 Tax=Streptomyces sp. GbtcB6 TaxID=2824751 RepID=UPI0027E43C96|nr:hypothetical protein [Streptomyces sp. GbtcB6]